MHSTEVKHYTRTSNKIEGWFSKDAARLFGWIDEIQKANHIGGDLFEIGCHHGKSAQLLGTMAIPETESLSVCDLFGLQADNVSNSGCGDRDIFESNMKSVRDHGTSYTIHQINSLQLKPADIGRNFRFFHVDGGHNPDEAQADLTLAAKCIAENGVIVLDDPFRSEWPGVTEGLIRFLDIHTEFEAILVGCNKIIITRKTASQIYVSEFESYHSQKISGFGYPWKIKSLPFQQSNLRILYIPDYRQTKSLGNLIRKLYHSTSLAAPNHQRTNRAISTISRKSSSIA